MRYRKPLCDILVFCLGVSVAIFHIASGLSESPSNTDPRVSAQGGPLLTARDYAALSSKAQDLILALAARDASQKQADRAVQASPSLACSQ